MKKQNSAVAELEAKLAAAEKDRERLKAAWAEEMQKSSMQMSASFDLLKLKKQIAIIAHIAAGRGHEAITELLDPAQLCFNIEVRYVDDETRNAAQDEMLKSVVKSVTDHLGSLAITRDKNEEKTGKD